MRKLFTFMLLAVALLVSVPSWAKNYPDGTEKNFKELGLPLIEPDLHGSYFGTLCVPQRIVATKGIVIYDVKCVDVNPKDTNDVVRLVIVEHEPCYGWQQYNPKTGEHYEDEPFCPEAQGTTGSDNPCDGKTYIDWIDLYNDDQPPIDYRMKAGGAYFYNVCDNGADSLTDRKIWVDANDVAAAPVCQNGFYGTFEQTQLNEPVTVLTQAAIKLPSGRDSTTQYLEQVTQVTMPANRGYFKGNFECVPWRWNTDDPYYKAHPEIYGTKNPRHNPCTGEIYDEPAEAPSRMIAFNVGRNATTGLYQIDFEHPIYFGEKESNKRIENGQLIIEVDGIMYNAFGQRIR